jgi:hypothetical protein
MAAFLLLFGHRLFLNLPKLDVVILYGLPLVRDRKLFQRLLAPVIDAAGCGAGIAAAASAGADS